MRLFHRQRSENPSPSADPSPSAPKLIDDIPKTAKWAADNLNATGYRADGTVDSLKEIDRFIGEQHRPGGALDGKFGNILFALGSYVGQVVIAAYGGEWVTDDSDPEGEINIAVKLANGGMIWPVVQLMKRIKEGPENAIFPYALAAGEDEKLRKINIDGLDKIGRDGK